MRTRNARLAAIHTLFRHAALLRPDDAAIIQVLAIPPKRFDRTIVTYLTETEITALLAAPDTTTWTGRRDRALLMLACQTGLRASELLGLTTTQIYIHADLKLKEKALNRTAPQDATPGRYQPTDQILAFLASL